MKYIKKKDWDTYLSDHLKEAPKSVRDQLPKNPNQGIQFEVVVECLLDQMFYEEELFFQNTRLSHDGSKDFWALDKANEVWWAECKNYTPNIALTQLAPTLILAEINQVSHLMFFSYSPLNTNLKKRIAQYSNKYDKEIFLYDDEALEQIIFLYDKEFLYREKIYDPVKHFEKLETIFFNEINASVVRPSTYNQYYEIKELHVGGIYDLNVILINRYQDTELDVKITIADNPCNSYFVFLNKDSNMPLDEWSNEVTLKPNQIRLVKCSVLAQKEGDGIALPQVLVTYEQNGTLHHEENIQNKKYVCHWNKKVVLIGKHYEDIIYNFGQECKKKLCMLLAYGTGGTGKTRILEECKIKLIKNQFNIINFIGFDSEASWKDVVFEISFQVFSLEKDLASTIFCEMDDIVLPNCDEPLKNKIISFLRLLRKEEVVDNLEEYYEIIFSEMCRNKYAIIVDNLQSYSPEIITFITKMIQFMGTHMKRKNSFALLISLNTALVYDKKYLDFASSFRTIVGANDNAGILFENITGFTKEEQAITYLKTLLCLDEYPLNYKYLKEVLKKSSLKPKYIELVAGRLLQEECIQLENNKGIITDALRLQKVLQNIPCEYEGAFCSNFEHMQSVYSKWDKDFKDILSCTYFFNALSENIIDLFKLNKDAILQLHKRDILKRSETFPENVYEFEHDLVEKTICEKIYPNLMEHAISLILKHSDIYEHSLKGQYGQYVLCKLFSANVSKEELLSIYANRERMHIPSKFIYKFYFYLVDNLINFKNEFSTTEFMNYICVCCKYVRDHVSEVQAEALFELAYAHLEGIPRNADDAMRLYFSFIIHLGENKIRLTKVSDCLMIYRRYYMQLEQNPKRSPELIRGCTYAKAYLDNRIFVCGKLTNNPRKYLANWSSSVIAAHKNHFWDIQFENYFDLANIYLLDNTDTSKALYNLNKGFHYFEKATTDQQKKYSVNYYSKKILYFLLKRDYQSSLSTINKAMEELKENEYINYHIFFQEKYKRFEIITLMLLYEFTTILDRCMEEYEHLLGLTGHLQDNFEWIFLQAKYAFYIKNHLNFKNLVKKYYIEFCNNENNNSSRNYCMLKELVIKYRKIYDTCDFVFERAAGLSEINTILKMDAPTFEQFFAEYKSTAPITSKDYKDGYLA